MDLEHAAAVLPFLYATILGVVMFWPPERLARWLIAGLFSFAGIVVSVLVWNQVNAQQASQAKLTGEIHGGDTCYFFPVVDPLSTPTGEMRWRLVAASSDHLPVYDVRIRIQHADRHDLNTAEGQAAEVKDMIVSEDHDLGTIPAGGLLTDVYLKSGAYQIGIYSRFSKRWEMMNFGPFGKSWGVSYAVRDMHGKIFDHATSPANFPRAYVDPQN